MTLALAAILFLAGPPRFLGPPERKPPDGEPAPLSPGDTAPFFSGAVQNATQAGIDRFDLAELVGPRVVAQTPAKVVLVSFFSRTCQACRKELGVLDALYTQYRSAGLRIVSVAADPGTLLRLHPASWPVLADPKGSITRLYLGRKPRYPSVVLLGADGKVISAKKGYRGDPAVLLRAELVSALR